MKLDNKINEVCRRGGSFPGSPGEGEMFMELQVIATKYRQFGWFGGPPFLPTPLHILLPQILIPPSFLVK